MQKGYIFNIFVKNQGMNKNLEIIKAPSPPQKLLKDNGKKQKVFLCIGSDKLIFDCLGPLTGTLLRNASNFEHYVYGTMAEPITARQVETAIRFIRSFHLGSEVIVVDSAVGKTEEIGKIKCFNRGLRPALGVDKEMSVVGDKSIMGIVTTKDKIRNLNTCNVKLQDVYNMAKSVSEMILSGEFDREGETSA